MNIAVCFALFLALAVVTESRAGDYYFCEGPKGELVISNQPPPPGSKIIKRLPEVTVTEVPQAQEPGKTEPSGQTEDSPKPPKDK